VAIHEARRHATRRLIEQLYADLGQAPVRAFIDARLAGGFTEPVAEAAIDRFLAQYGALATLDRTDVATRRTPAFVESFVRFQLPRAVYDQIAAAYRETFEFRGLTVAPYFPLLAKVLPGNASLVVIGVAPRSTAAASRIAVGDLISMVGNVHVPTLAAFRTETRSAWAQPDVRRRLTLAIERAGKTSRAFVGKRDRP
jgi:hypothetical protein